MQEGVVLSSYIMKCCVSIYLAPKHRPSYLLRKPPFLWILKKFKRLSFENRFLNANVPARANPKMTGTLRRESLSVGSGGEKESQSQIVPTSPIIFTPLSRSVLYLSTREKMKGRLVCKPPPSSTYIHTWTWNGDNCSHMKTSARRLRSLQISHLHFPKCSTFLLIFFYKRLK